MSPLVTKVLGFERIYARISVLPHGHGDCIVSDQFINKICQLNLAATQLHEGSKKLRLGVTSAPPLLRTVKPQND